jgi:hypothetical protein
MLEASTATENNTEENGTTTIKCAKQLPGKETTTKPRYNYT